LEHRPDLSEHLSEIPYLSHPMNNLFSYFRNVRAELAHVVWPTPRKAIMDVIAVVIISAVVALLIAGLDYAFTGLVNYVVSHQQ
jgi:preprotein translocase SecE subunit